MTTIAYDDDMELQSIVEQSYKEKHYKATTNTTSTTMSSKESVLSSSTQEERKTGVKKKEGTSNMKETEYSTTDSSSDTENANKITKQKIEKNNYSDTQNIYSVNTNEDWNDNTSTTKQQNKQEQRDARAPSGAQESSVSEVRTSVSSTKEAPVSEPEQRDARAPSGAQESSVSEVRTSVSSTKEAPVSEPEQRDARAPSGAQESSVSEVRTSVSSTKEAPVSEPEQRDARAPSGAQESSVSEVRTSVSSTKEAPVSEPEQRDARAPSGAQESSVSEVYTSVSSTKEAPVSEPEQRDARAPSGAQESSVSEVRTSVSSTKEAPVSEPEQRDARAPSGAQESSVSEVRTSVSSTKEAPVSEPEQRDARAPSGAQESSVSEVYTSVSSTKEAPVSEPEQRDARAPSGAQESSVSEVRTSVSSTKETTVSEPEQRDARAPSGAQESSVSEVYTSVSSTKEAPVSEPEQRDARAPSGAQESSVSEVRTSVSSTKETPVSEPEQRDARAPSGAQESSVSEVRTSVSSTKEAPVSEPEQRDARAPSGAQESSVSEVRTSVSSTKEAPVSEPEQRDARAPSGAQESSVSEVYTSVSSTKEAPVSEPEQRDARAPSGAQESSVSEVYTSVSSTKEAPVSEPEQRDARAPSGAQESSVSEVYTSVSSTKETPVSEPDHVCPNSCVKTHVSSHDSVDSYSSVFDSSSSSSISSAHHSSRVPPVCDTDVSSVCQSADVSSVDDVSVSSFKRVDVDEASCRSVLCNSPVSSDSCVVKVRANLKNKVRSFQRHSNKNVVRSENGFSGCSASHGDAYGRDVNVADTVVGAGDKNPNSFSPSSCVSAQKPSRFAAKGATSSPDRRSNAGRPRDARRLILPLVPQRAVQNRSVPKRTNIYDRLSVQQRVYGNVVRRLYPFSPRSGNRSSSPVSSAHTSLVKKIESVKAELNDVRRSLQLLRSPRGKNRVQMQANISQWEIERLRREKNNLQRLLDISANGNISFEMLFCIAQEEYAQACEELAEMRRRKRELLSNCRVASLMISQAAKLEMTPRDRRTRQYQEGMYTRATIQAKLNEVSSKIRVTRATSSNLHHLIRDLENRVAREGLSDIKPAAYRNLQKKVNDNAKLIERLNDAILLSGGSVNATQDSGASECDEVLDKVRFPGKEKLEALSNKLSNQLSSLEERIAVIRSKLTVTPSTIELSHKPSASIRRTDEKLPTNDSECLDPASSHSITKFVLSTCPPHEHDANKAAAESKVTSECNESSATPGFSAPSILSAVKQPKQISANECHNASNLQVKYDTDHAPVKVAPLPPLVKSGRVLASKGNTVVSSMVSRTLNAKPFLCNNPTTLANAIAERTGAVLQSVLPPINGKPKGIRDIPTLDGRSGDVMQGLAELDRSVGAGEKEAVRAAGSSTVSDVTKSDESVGAGEKEAVRAAGSSTVSDVTKSGESVGAGEKEAVRAAGSSTVSDVTKSGESVGAGEKEAVRAAGSSTVSDVTKSGESVGAGEKEAVRAAGSSTVSDVTKSASRLALVRRRQ
ncbi:hypothetical protein ERJ75_000959500 [Trypanosoma vivax]|nr:hypothetical protein ERJ75_000959500 [Trypanosoma vivax]